MIRPLAIGEFHRTVTPEMVAALDAKPLVAARAALAIGRTKNVNGAAPLREHFDAKDPSVRAMVVYALGLIGDRGSLPGFHEACSDKNSAVRYAAVDALGRVYAAADATILTKDAADGLLATATNDTDPVVRGHAIAQLDAFRQMPFAESIAKSLQQRESQDPDESVRWHAAWMLFRSYAKFADLAFLAHASRDGNELVRVESLRALGRRPEPHAIDIVRLALDDPSWRVQFEAREALRRLRLLPATQHLKTMPPGINLPRLAVKPDEDPFVPLPGPSPLAPDPAAYALGNALLPRNATEMNGPQPGLHPRVLLQTTKGNVIVRLYPEWAPSTVANFLDLTKSGYFNGDRWFRIVPDFVVQTGDATNTGDGDAGYTIPAEENPIEQRSGIIAMGLNYDDKGAIRDSAGTQFYVTLSPQLHLDRAFSVFGEIVSGFDVLANMDERDKILVATRLCDA